MKDFKSIEEWLAINPPEKELSKVLNFVNKGLTNQIRRTVWLKESYLKKLQGIIRHFDKLDMKPPQDVVNKIIEIRTEIDILKKDLPVPNKRAKKTEDVVES